MICRLIIVELFWHYTHSFFAQIEQTCLRMHIAFLTVEKKELQKSRFILKETGKSSTMLTPLLAFLQLPHDVCSTCQRNLSTLPVTVGATEALTCDSLLNIYI